MHRKSLLALTAISLIQLACAQPPGVRLIDDASHRVLREVEVVLHIDDGVRCVTTPCPTDSREWQGRTDTAGRIELPVVGVDETATLFVAGYTPIAVDHEQRTIRLKGPLPPAPPEQKFSLAIRFEEDAGVLSLRLENPGPDPLSVVNPASPYLAQYGDWGGWGILLKDSRGPFLPVPFPGAFVAATRFDVVQLQPGQEWTARISVRDWRRPGVGQPASHDIAFREATGELTARIRWGGMPDHLDKREDSPSVIASASARRAPSG